MISPHISYCKYSLALTDLLTNCQSSVFYSFSSWFPSHMHTLHLIDSIFTSGLVRASPSLLGLASPLCVPVQTMSQSDRWTGPVPWKLEQYSRDVTMHIQTRPWGSKGEKGDVQITAAVNLITVFLSCLSICLATCLPKAVPALMFGVQKTRRCFEFLDPVFSSADLTSIRVTSCWFSWPTVWVKSVRWAQWPSGGLNLTF